MTFSAPTKVEAPRLTHLRSLDGLRGVAVLAVVLFHFEPSIAPGGFLGVDVFFVLSGFLITSLLVSEWEKRGRVALGGFWARRARRLLPALLLLLVVVLLFELATEPDFIVRRVANDGVSALTYVANWHFITTDQPYVVQIAAQTPSPLHHVWSLAIEEQFYLVWPLGVVGVSALVARARRHGRRRRALRRTLAWTVLLLAVASLAWMVILYQPGEDPSRVYFGTDTHAFPLMIGAALGAMSAGVPTVEGKRRTALVALGVLLAAVLVGVMASVRTDSTWLYEGGYGLVALAMAVVLAAAAQPGLNPLRHLLEHRVLVGLGLISYGIYLWHWPVFVWLTESNTSLGGSALFVARAAVTVGIALASYFLLEQPIRAGRVPRWGMRAGLAPMAIVTCVAVLVVFPTVAFPSVAEAPPTGDTTEFDATAAAAYRSAPRCDETPPDSQPLTVDGRPLRLQLVGNSFAGEMSRCLRTILRSRGARLDEIVEDGNTICLLADRIRARTTSHPPDVAVIFQYATPAGGSCTEWQAEVDRVVSTWTTAGAHVLLVPSVPIPGETSWDDGTLRAYSSAAQRDPANVTVVDAGVFLRDAEGRSQWAMPCVAPDEPGCRSGVVAVRWPGDRGVHFCSDPWWLTRKAYKGEAGGLPVCAPRFAAGQRRLTAALALELFAWLGVDPAGTATAGTATAPGSS